MIVRVLLAVLVAGALVGAAAPVVEDARRDVAATSGDREAQRVADAIVSMTRHSDPVPRGVPGARRVLRVDPGGVGDTVVTLRIGSTRSDGAVDGPDADVVSYSAAAGTSGRVRVPVDVRGTEGRGLSGDGSGVVVSEPTTVVLRFVLVDDRPTVTVARRSA